MTTNKKLQLLLLSVIGVLLGSAILSYIVIYRESLNLTFLAILSVNGLASSLYYLVVLGRRNRIKT